MDSESLDGEFNAQSDFFSDFQTDSFANSKKNSKPKRDSLKNEKKIVKNQDSQNPQNSNFAEKIPKNTKENKKSIFNTSKTFSSLGLIKPLLKAISDLEYEKPTKIQEQVIPLILNGKDVLGSSATGSGKTAAFALPILQKFSGSYSNETRALIIIPTRELATQCFEMMKSLNKYTKLSLCLVIGAVPIEKQEAELRRRPCIVIATPGRLIDILKNSKNIELDSIETLIFDEADRLLELGFELEMRELVKSLPPERQTLLFSATLSSTLTSFGKLTLNKPVRIAVGEEHQTAEGITQKIFLLKNGSMREALLLYILRKKVSKEKLLQFQCEELHGDIPQASRLKAFNSFKREECNLLLATDVAARGIDVPNIQFVVNFEIPVEGVRYIHRVGRTARAGKDGCSITICTKEEFRLLKKMLKSSNITFDKTIVPESSLSSFKSEIESLEYELKRLFAEERAEKELKKAEIEANKASNMILYKEEILNKPKREWIASKKDRNQIRANDKLRFESIEDNSQINDENAKKKTKLK